MELKDLQQIMACIFLILIGFGLGKFYEQSYRGGSLDGGFSLDLINCERGYIRGYIDAGYSGYPKTFKSRSSCLEIVK
jgi:hypothetical protein